MRKRNSLLLFLLVIGCIYYSSINVNAYTIDKNYDPDVAAMYAKAWATGYNTHAFYIAPGWDCTNFVSQCIEQGGKVTTSSPSDPNSISVWRPHSVTWETADKFRQYWSARVSSAGKNMSGYTPEKKI